MGRISITGSQETSVDRPIAPAYYRLTIYLIVAAALILVLYHGGAALIAGSRAPVKLVVYAFSTQEELLGQHIFPAFKASWEAQSGREIEIEGVYGPSGTLANQILLGAPADVAILSNAQHVAWLQVGRKLLPDTEPAIIGHTPMVIVTRSGNPLQIQDYVDLAQPSLELLHPEPGRSGAGDWAVLAEYGSAYLENRDRAAAEALLSAIWQNVRVLGTSARATLSLFELGAGDALLTYEQDALLAQQRGAPLEIVLPRRTIIAQHVAVVIDDNLKGAEEAAAHDFINYLLSEAGQALLGEYQLRTLSAESGDFQALSDPFTVEELGGWSKAYQDLIEGYWTTQIMPGITVRSLQRLTDGRD